MELNRNISVLVLKSLKGKKRVIDVLAGTGIRGIRYAKEAGVKELILNDLNPSAVRLMEKNVKLNKIKSVIFREDANYLLSKFNSELDFIDIDPFGSPVYFLDSAAKAISNNGVLAITATDTAPLAGTYPKTCIKRYGSKSLRCDMQHEIGIRILIANIAEECSKHGKEFVPLLCFSKIHYFRIFGKVRISKKSEKNRGYILCCNRCGYKQFSKNIKPNCKNCKSKIDYAGPLWTAGIFEPLFCKKVYEKATGKESRILRIINEESKNYNLFYDIHDLCKKYKLIAPKMDKIIEEIRKKKFDVSRTHFLPTGIRTNADIKTLRISLKNY